MTRTATRTEPEAPGPTYGITIRAQYPNTIGMLGKIASAIGGAGGDIGAVDIVRVVKNEIVRDISVATRDDLHAREVVKAVRDLPQVTVREVSAPPPPSWRAGPSSSRSWAASTPGPSVWPPKTRTRS